MPRLQPIETDAVQIGHASERGKDDVGCKRLSAAHLTSTCEKPSKRAPLTSQPPQYSPPMA